MKARTSKTADDIARRAGRRLLAATGSCVAGDTRFAVRVLRASMPASCFQQEVGLGHHQHVFLEQEEQIDRLLVGPFEGGGDLPGLRRGERSSGSNSRRRGGQINGVVLRRIGHVFCLVLTLKPR